MHPSPVAKGTVPNRASHGLRRLLPCVTHSSPLPAPCSVRGMGRCSCLAPRAKARDEAERDEHRAPAEEGGEEAGAERRPRERSMAYQLFEGVYLCAYVCSWRIGELIVVNAQDALGRLRGYVREKFNQKR